MALVVACSEDSGPATVRIGSFTPTPSDLTLGDSITLAWTVANADSVRFEPGIGYVTGTMVTLAPAATTRFVLYAMGAGGRDSAAVTVTVTVPPPPSIATFEAAAASIVAGRATTLAWSVSAADSVTIDQGIGRVVGAGLAVAPSATTTYTLVAYGLGGSSSSAATVSVSVASAPPPAPTNVRALGTSSGAVVLWDPVPLASGYRVEASTQSQPAFTVITTPDSTHRYAVHAGGAANSINYYRVYAVNPAGASVAVQASALVVPPPPEGPALAVVPSWVTVAPGDSALFTVQPASSVTWALEAGAFSGRLSSSDWYTAPGTPGAHLVVASSVVAALAVVVVP